MPTLEDFILKLEEKFGKLNPQAEHYAEDFLLNYENFIIQIRLKKILFGVFADRLSSQFHDSKYSKYKFFGSLSIVLFLISIVVLFFNWKYSIGCFIGFIVLKKYSNYLKSSGTESFVNEINLKFLDNQDDAMFDVCQLYIGGILQLVSVKGVACTPLLPSYCLSGVKVFARSIYKDKRYETDEAENVNESYHQEISDLELLAELDNVETAPVANNNCPNEQIGELTDDEFIDAILNDYVTDVRLVDIATKLRNNEKLSNREQKIARKYKESLNDDYEGNTGR